MPVAYSIRENKLTTPPSYSCQITAEETLGYDDIAEFIHLLKAGTVQTVQHDAPAEDCRVEAILRPDDSITLAIGPYTGDLTSPPDSWRLFSLSPTAITKTFFCSATK